MRIKSKIKRVIDLLVGVLATLFLFPIWILAVAIILVSDFGPVLFRQKRIGLDEREFMIFKFRTMYFNQETSASTTTQNDPRVFPGGNFLRRFKIDELPQLINVINGTMSLVGPRPTVAEDVQKMTKIQRRRFSVRPGITGLAQVSGNTSLPWAQRIEYDLDYIDNWSLYLDLVVLLKTALLVVGGKADTHPPDEDEWKQK